MSEQEMFARLQSLVDQDDDHFVAHGESLEWLVEQLLEWPRRIHPERTTNGRFLRYSIAATLLDALTTLASRTPEGMVREVPSHVDDDYTRAFIDGWNARLDHTDFDMALHFWMLSHARPMTPTPEGAE